MHGELLSQVAFEKGGAVHADEIVFLFQFSKEFRNFLARDTSTGDIASIHHINIVTGSADYAFFQRH